MGRPLCYTARGAVGGSVSCSRVSPQSWYWGWSERWTFTPPTYLRLEPVTFGLSPTLYPLGHDCPNCRLLRIHWWASDVMLHFSKMFGWTNKLICILSGLRVSKFSANFHFWVNCSFNYDVWSAPIASCAARWHVAPLLIGRPVFESQLAGLSRSRPPLSLQLRFLSNYGPKKGKNTKHKS